MFLETIRSEGLAHLSYIFGDGEKAAVVDPRRDARIYVDIAYAWGCQIAYIFETHRNEDYVVGSLGLARLTGAGIYHGANLDFRYGNPVYEGDQFELGSIRLTVLNTPGHTLESISLAFVDKEFGEDPVGVFTGDALFIGDVGRTDFFPDRAREVAGFLYDSIFKKLLPLGDQVILYPAHGAGSVCGAGMASREFSTLGYERRYNPVLRITDKETFIQYKIDELHEQPPYFRQMEKYNLEGSAPLLERMPNPKPLGADAFAEKASNGALILDVRSPEAIGGALIPGSLGIPLEMIPAFAGWFLPYDRDILLVVQDYSEVEKAVRFLLRLGYDRIPGFLEEGLHAWEVTGRRYDQIPSIHAGELVRRIRAEEDFTLLDVRKKAEFNEGRLPNSTHIYVGELPHRLEEISRMRPVVTFCGSGRRAVIAAAILKQNDFKNVENCLGSMAACAANACPVIQGSSQPKML